jgi:integrase/recombinase XerC
VIPLLEITMDTAQHSRVIEVDWLSASPMGPHAVAFKRQLPVATGEAIAKYLELECPKTTNRAIFVRNVAPRDVPTGADLIRKTIRQALRQA